MPFCILKTEKSLLFLIILFLTFITTNLASQQPPVNITRLSVTEGLSQSTVNCIIQDRQGFMWFGTQDGLNKYDGYDFTVYKYDPLDSSSLSGNFINTIYEDRRGILWIGTEGGGLSSFDPKTEEFNSYRHDPNNANSLSHNRVGTILEDPTGTLWIGTIGGGLNKLVWEDPDHLQPKFVRYKHEPDNPNSLSHDRVWNILEGSNGELWLGTNRGLNNLNPKTGVFKHYKHDPINPNSLSTDFVWSSYRDKSGKLWIGTYNGGLNRLIPSDGEGSLPIFVHYKHDPDNGNSLSNNIVSEIIEDKTGMLWLGTFDGLNRFDPKTEKFVLYKNDQNDPNTLSGNRLHSIFIDNVNALWVGTFSSGVNRLDLNQQKFSLYRNSPNKTNSISNNVVTSISEDKMGRIWIGTFNNGLNNFDRETETFTHYKHNPEDSESLSSSMISAIHGDSQGNVWVGVYLKGLYKITPNHKFIQGLDGSHSHAIINYRNDPNEPSSLSHNIVSSLYEDDAGVLWVGTTGGGLNKFILSEGKRSLIGKEKFVRYHHAPNDPKSLSSNTVMVIYKDKTGILWIGTRSGLNRFDSETQTFSPYKHNFGNPFSLSNDIVYSINEDQAGNLWVGTSAGLNKFNRRTQNFTRFTEKKGLPNGAIYAILFDEHGRLWMSTNKGLSKFDPETKAFRNYDVNDGLQANEFNLGAFHKSKNGELYFGGINGLNRFHPDSVKDNEHIPPIIITDFKLFNESVPVSTGGQSPLEKHISVVEELELSYRDNVFSFEFVALDYMFPEKNQYAYMLDGFEKKWIYSGTRRFAMYTNMEPGNYTFKVKGSNNDGIWNESGTSVKVIIHPQFWQTLWFRGFVFGSILFIVFGIHRHRMGIKLQKIKTIEETKKRVADEFHDELGNSLTKISLYGEVLKKKLNFTEPEILRIVQRITDVSNMTYDNMKDFIWSLKTDNESMFELTANIVRFGYEFYEDTTIEFVDRSSRHDALKKIVIDAKTKRHILLLFKEAMNNILKHAQCTQVTFEVKPLSEYISFTLSDNGVGFPRQENEYGNGIANMRYRSESIGGTFEINSEAGRGTCLNLTVPKIN